MGREEAQRIPAHHQRPETGGVPVCMESRDLLGAVDCSGFLGKFLWEDSVGEF